MQELAKPKFGAPGLFFSFNTCKLTWLEPAIQSKIPGQQSKKKLTLMISKLEPVIWSCDTGQKIPCFDGCHLTIKCVSKMYAVN